MVSLRLARFQRKDPILEKKVSLKKASQRLYQNFLRDAFKITFNLFLSPEDDLAILFLYSLRVSFSGGSTCNPSGLLGRGRTSLASYSDFALWEVLALALFKGFIQFLSMHLSVARPSSAGQRGSPPLSSPAELQGCTPELSAAIWLISLQFSSETVGYNSASLSFCRVLDGSLPSGACFSLWEFCLCGSYLDCLATFSALSE